MQGDAVGADVGEVVNDVDGIERFADFDAEGVAAGVADRPETEREAIVGLWVRT